MTDTWQTVGKQRGPNVSLIIDCSIDFDNDDSILSKQEHSDHNNNIYNIRILSSQWISLSYIKNIHQKMFNMDIGCITNIERKMVNNEWITSWTRVSDYKDDNFDHNIIKKICS